MNKDLGEKLKQNGIQLALFNAERSESGWKDKAIEMLARFLKIVGDRPFKAESLGEWAYKQGLKRPPNSKAWGAVMLSAKRQKLIKSVGLATADLPTSHRGYITLWQRCQEGE